MGVMRPGGWPVERGSLVASWLPCLQDLEVPFYRVPGRARRGFLWLGLGPSGAAGVVVCVVFFGAGGKVAADWGGG